MCWHYGFIGIRGFGFGGLFGIVLMVLAILVIIKLAKDILFSGASKKDRITNP